MVVAHAQPHRSRFGMFGSPERTCHAMHFAIVNGRRRVQFDVVRAFVRVKLRLTVIRCTVIR